MPSQRQGPTPVVMSSQSAPPPLPPAALADRVKAGAIDAAIIYGAAWLIGQMVWVSAWTSWRYPLPFGGQTTTLLPWLPLLVAALYWFTEVAGGRSPGKRIVGVRVVTAEGGKPGFGVLKKRWMIKIGVFTGTMFLCMVLWQIQMGSPMRNEPWLLNRLVFFAGAGIQVAVLISLLGMRGLHDRLAGCTVARFDAAAAMHPAWTAGELHVKQLILKTPRLLLNFVKSASGIGARFDHPFLHRGPQRRLSRRGALSHHAAGAHADADRAGLDVLFPRRHGLVGSGGLDVRLHHRCAARREHQEGQSTAAAAWRGCRGGCAGFPRL
jgi:uncharacterized RDD family membrane protein YckC